jgi:hypothetical protein
MKPSIRGIINRYKKASLVKDVIMSRGVYEKIDATSKWVEYNLDILELQKGMSETEFRDRFDIEQTIDLAKRKIKWHYNHENFDHLEAGKSLKKSRRLLGL